MGVRGLEQSASGVARRRGDNLPESVAEEQGLDNGDRGSAVEALLGERLADPVPDSCSLRKSRLWPSKLLRSRLLPGEAVREAYGRGCRRGIRWGNATPAESVGSMAAQ